jgi:methionyl aminopeptidase
VIKDGYHGDTSKMFMVGKVLDIGPSGWPRWPRSACIKCIGLLRPGARLGDIGDVIQKHAEKNHFSVVREYCGHGIGAIFHEEPQVLHYGTRRHRHGTGAEGMTFTIEPMINQGRAMSPAAPRRLDRHHQGSQALRPVGTHLLVTADGYEILTLRSEVTPCRAPR